MPATPAWPPTARRACSWRGRSRRGSRSPLEGPQAHYLARVMRVAEGDAVILCDDLTGEWAARVASAGKRDVALEVTEQLREREQVPDFTLCAALLKKDRFDLVLEKATELGVRHIQPVLARRCVADKLNLDRARATITEAAEQCARTALPELAEPGEAGRPAQGPRSGPSRCSSPTSWAANRRARPSRANPGPAALLIGPEGGFDDAEREAIRALPSAVPITLGPRILRGETAAIAASALWMAVAGDW